MSTRPKNPSITKLAMGDLQEVPMISQRIFETMI
jgi:hypothetical protein